MKIEKENNLYLFIYLLCIYIKCQLCITEKMAIFPFSDRYELLDKPSGQVSFTVEGFIQQTSLPVYVPEEMQCILKANDLAANIIKLKGNKL